MISDKVQNINCTKKPSAPISLFTENSYVHAVLFKLNKLN